MSKVHMLRALVKQRLTAAAEEIFGLFERTIAEYEEELCRSKEENQRQRKLLDAVFNPQVQLHTADVEQLLRKEEVPPEQQEWSPSLDQEDPEPPHIKEEQEEVWSSQEGEQLQGLEEADITKFTFTPVPVKSEDDEEKPQSSELHQSQTEENREDCGGPGPDRNPGPDHLSGPDEDETTSDVSDELRETRKHQSGFTSVKKVRCSSGVRWFHCSECGKRFSQNSNLKTHMRIHTGEKPFNCSICGKRFIQKIHLTHHMARHTGEKLFGCSICDQRFTWLYQLRNHQCDGETGADGEDCGGPEPDWDPGPDGHLHPQTEAAENWTMNVKDSVVNRNSDSFKTFGHKHRRTHTGEKRFSCCVCDKTFISKFLLNEHTRLHAGEKSFTCEFCEKSFGQRLALVIHTRIHTGEKPFKCSVCEKKFNQASNLKVHMRIHTGEKPHCCSVCGTGFTQRSNLLKHMRRHQFS